MINVKTPFEPDIKIDSMGSPRREYLVRNMAYLVRHKNLRDSPTELSKDSPVTHAISELPS